MPLYFELTMDAQGARGHWKNAGPRLAGQLERSEYIAGCVRIMAYFLGGMCCFPIPTPASPCHPFIQNNLQSAKGIYESILRLNESVNTKMEIFLYFSTIEMLFLRTR